MSNTKKQETGVGKTSTVNTLEENNIVTTIGINILNVLPNPDEYIQEINACEWVDFETPTGVFKGIQERGVDDFYSIMTSFFPDFDVEMNFVRRSPLNQVEPNYIHKDDMHGDKTAILYLNKQYPSNYGTTLYDNMGKELIVNKAQYNSAFIFDSNINHSRNIKNNFGTGHDARTVQVMFLKHK